MEGLIATKECQTSLKNKEKEVLLGVTKSRRRRKTSAFVVKVGRNEPMGVSGEQSANAERGGRGGGGVRTGRKQCYG